MRPDEEFVGGALVEFLGGPSRASFSDGEDPPDLYVSTDGTRTGVEVTRLSEFTFEPDGTIGNRATQDLFGIRLINELDAKVGPTLPTDISLWIGLSLPVRNASRLKKALIERVTEIAASPFPGLKEDLELEGSRVSISVTLQRPSGKKIAGFVDSNANTSADIGGNARLILEERIRAKTKTCARLPKPIWLAVLNDYWLANADTYALAASQLKVHHCFERILLISEQGSVDELKLGA